MRVEQEFTIFSGGGQVSILCLPLIHLCPCLKLIVD